MVKSGEKATVFSKLYEFVLKYGIYLFALAIVAINVSLIFDNVLWGDEAATINFIRGTGYVGVYQRIYAFDCHPPFYYFYLKTWSLVLGEHVWVYHLASVVPFIATIVLSLTVIKKSFGAIPSAFLILFTGLSTTCTEYNQEVRMYALCFTFMLGAAYFSYRIAHDYRLIKLWVGFVILGVLAAYTHYYGFMISGILLFMTALIVFIRNKGKTWLYGVLSIVAYLVLYSPWLLSFIKQLGDVKLGFWIEEPDKLDVVLKLVFGGEHLNKIFFPFIITISIIYLLMEFGIFTVTYKKEEGMAFIVSRPRKKVFTDESAAFLGFYLTAFSTFAFAYAASALFRPILINRYMYPLIPIVLFILMTSVKRIIAISSKEKETDNAIETEISAVKNPCGRLFVFAIVIVWVVSLVVGLKDFIYFRSVCKTQNLYTEKILTMIGTPEEDTVFTVEGVSHLAWSVLPYYFPEARVVNGSPVNVDDAGEIWAFMGYELDEYMIEELEARGYETEVYWDMVFTKYNCTLYHFSK